MSINIDLIELTCYIKVMPTIKEIQEAWSLDANLDELRLDKESTDHFKLHSKYINWLYDENISMIRLELEMKKLYSTLEGYFKGEIDGKTINKPPFQIKVATNDRITRLIEADEDYQKFKLSQEIKKQKILMLKDIIFSINQRSYHINNAIEYRKFISGGK